MSTLELYHQIEQLPPQEQLVLAQQILAGLMHQLPFNTVAQPVQQEPSVMNQRVAGLHAGTAWMSDDFDELLPDAFWLGNSETHGSCN